MTDRPTIAVEDYLKTIHHLGESDEGVAFPHRIAERLKVSAPSVTGMLKRLAECGWIEYAAPRGVRLTPAGVTEARRVIRRHRLVELFLTRVLGLDWSEVDAEAEALEHAISPRLEQALADHLGEPREDPHGHPIPTAEGLLDRRELRPLTEFAAGEQLIIREVRDEHPERLRRWRELGLIPGTPVRIRSHQPLDGLFEVQIGDKVLALGAEGLAGLSGEAVSGPPKGDSRPIKEQRP